MKVEEAQKRNDIRNTIPFHKAQKGIETENGIDKAEIAWKRLLFLFLYFRSERGVRRGERDVPDKSPPVFSPEHI
jgi:hypothetical protein